MCATDISPDADHMIFDSPPLKLIPSVRLLRACDCARLHIVGNKEGLEADSVINQGGWIGRKEALTFRYR